VVDDDPVQRAIVIRELRVPFPDLVAHEVADAAAFDRALGGEVDLVVTEHRLAWTSGLRVLSTVRDRQPHAAVVVFTSAGCQETAVTAIKAGVDDYVAKSPLHLVRLRAAAVRAIDEARQRQAVAAAEGRYRRLVEEVPVGLYQLAADGRIADANPAMGDLVGMSRDALVGTSKWALYRRPAESARWQMTMASHGVVRDFETEWMRADGRVVHVRESARAVDGAGGARHYDGVVEALDAPRRDANGRLASQFLRHVSEELRTQLHVIVGMTQLALEGPLADEPRGFLESAEDAAMSLRNLLARIASQAAAFDLRSAVQDALNALGAGAAERGLALVCHVPDAMLSRVVGDERRFREILVQLVGNAIARKPSGPVAVTVAADEVGVRLEVADADVEPANGGVAFAGVDDAETGLRVTLPFASDVPVRRRIASPGF
jgi:PAS domain S-box-containing protein